MSDTITDIDEVRYRHHLEHRGSANLRILWAVWSCVIAFLLLRLGRRMFGWWQRRLLCKNHGISQSSDLASPLNRGLSLVEAAAILPLPEMIRWICTLSLGKASALSLYFLGLVSLLFAVDAPASTPHFADDVAFRAAWVTITQLPLIFFLSTKRGPINIIANVSYEKINWLHKWIGRMVFISATTHIAIMKSSISMVDILVSHDRGLTIVRYGIGSYFLLVWIAVSSILPVRRWSYRAFYINHWLSTLGFLMLIIQHVPRHATTPIYLSFALLAFDRALVAVSFLRSNVSVRSLEPRLAKFRRASGRAMLVAGYPVEMLEPHNLSTSRDVEESTTTIRICNLPISWRPGQHVRLYLPALGAFEMHPFTPANCSSIAMAPPLPPRRSQDAERRGSATSSASSKQSNDMLLMICAHTGLTRRLKTFHSEWLRLPCPNATVSSTATSLTAYVDGPYGSPPVWEDFHNLVLITTSTGVSFALSVLDYLEQLCFADVSNLRTQSIRFVWIVRHLDPQFEASVAEFVRRYSMLMRDSGVQIEVDLFVTCSRSEVKPSMTDIDQFAHLRPRMPRHGSGDRTLTIRNPDEIYDEWEEEERQWAELEALEEMQMKEVDPFADSYELHSGKISDGDITSVYAGEGYASSESSTLLDSGGDEQNTRHSDNPSAARLTVAKTGMLNTTRPLPSPVRSPLLPRHTPRKGTCQCALVQCQRRKLRKPARSIFDNISYGVRPNIFRTVSSFVERGQHGKTMVAVCANDTVSRQANKAVAQEKLAFARGQRASDVEIFTEGFS